MCSSVDDLSASMDKLDENGRAQLESQLATVRADLAQVRAAADQQYGEQVATVTAAVSTVRERFHAANSEPSESTLRPRAAIAKTSAPGSVPYTKRSLAPADVLNHPHPPGMRPRPEAGRMLSTGATRTSSHRWWERS
jgi:hypothetical protein